jgi:RNA polymerase sigma factor (sigma-70 family)
MASHAGVVVSGPGTDDPQLATGPAEAGAAGAEDRPGDGGVVEAAPASFADLYLRSFAEMVRLAHVLVDSPETAEDLVQDAFVHLHRHWGGVRDPRSYLHRSVVNACRSHHRRAWRERARVPRTDGASTTADTGGRGGVDIVDGSAEQGRSDDAGVLGVALATLPYRQRAALVLRYYADLPDAEIAVALGCRPGTVGSLVHRGLERLREVVDHER